MKQTLLTAPRDPTMQHQNLGKPARSQTLGVSLSTGLEGVHDLLKPCQHRNLSYPSTDIAYYILQAGRLGDHTSCKNSAQNRAERKNTAGFCELGPLSPRREFLTESPKKLTRVAAPSPRASLGRRTVCGRTEQLSAAGFEALRN